MGCKTSFSVLDGGKFKRKPQAIAIGLGAQGLSAHERAAIKRACGRGVQVVIFTALDEERAHAELGALGECASLRRDALDCDADASLTRRAARANALAGYVQERDLGFDGVAVIATEPADRDMLMCAGIACALASAGYEALAAADRRFPARARGGLMQALDFLCGLG